jgi:Sulfotransferase domain
MGRTGTMSLKMALTRLLGGPCYHMAEVFEKPAHFGLWTAAGRGLPVDWDALFEGYVAAVDWPAAAFWPELSQAYPEAHIVLSTRDSASWWKSASETIFAPKSAAARPAPMVEMIEAVLGSRFTKAFTEREPAILAYERNNARARETIPAARLVEWTTKDGWGPLCKMLGVPVPANPFPHANTTEEFQARVAAGHGPPPAP